MQEGCAGAEVTHRRYRRFHFDEVTHGCNAPAGRHSSPLDFLVRTGQRSHGLPLLSLTDLDPVCWIWFSINLAVLNGKYCGGFCLGHVRQTASMTLRGCRS